MLCQGWGLDSSLLVIYQKYTLNWLDQEIVKLIIRSEILSIRYS